MAKRFIPEQIIVFKVCLDTAIAGTTLSPKASFNP